MRKLLLALVILACICSPALAGKNANGAMIVHTSNTYNYSAATVCTATQGDPGTCANAVTEATRTTGQVVWLLGAFLPSANPGVTVVYFGINYDDTTLDPGIAYKFCGPSGTLEVPDGDWPYAGRGNSVAFGAPVAGQTLFRFYVFKIDGGAAGSYFGTGINPTGGYAGFVDDSNPPDLDYCTSFGQVRWFEAGHNDCPIPPPATGACCFADGHCQVETQAQCEGAGGAYQGDNTSCDPNPCPQPTGACCFADGTCTVETELVCLNLSGAWQGPDTVCNPNPCVQPTGACCFADGSCIETTAADCEAHAGQYHGNGTTCTPNPCAQPTGACCYVDGSCVVQPQGECGQAGGQYLGNNTSCDPNPCPQPPTGACCFADGSCTVTTAGDCDFQGGAYQGNGTVCDPNPCVQPTGACCFADGNCTVLTGADCQNQGGSYQGNGTVCDPNACPPPPPADGACCFGDGTCQVLTQDECTAAGGTLWVEGGTCDPNPCPPVPTKNSTWGQIKATYR